MIEYFRDRDDLLFAFRDRHQLWVWRDDQWHHEHSGSYLQVHLHQAAYRGDGKARRLDERPEGVPEPPARPPRRKEPSHQAPELAKLLQPGHSRVYLVLSYSGYDQLFGDGRHDSVDAAFLERERADARASELGKTARVRGVDVMLDGDAVRIRDQGRGRYETWDVADLVRVLSASLETSGEEGARDPESSP